jgi:hypothetical protein
LHHPDKESKAADDPDGDDRPYQGSNDEKYKEFFAPRAGRCLISHSRFV